MKVINYRFYKTNRCYSLADPVPFMHLGLYRNRIQIRIRVAQKDRSRILLTLYAFFNLKKHFKSFFISDLNIFVLTLQIKVLWTKDPDRDTVF